MCPLSWTLIARAGASEMDPLVWMGVAAAVAAVMEGKIYVAGGMNNGGMVLDSTYCYDLETRQAVRRISGQVLARVRVENMANQYSITYLVYLLPPRYIKGERVNEPVDTRCPFNPEPVDTRCPLNPEPNSNRHAQSLLLLLPLPVPVPLQLPYPYLCP